MGRRQYHHTRRRSSTSSSISSSGSPLLLLQTTNISSLSRKVSSTAGSLIGPFADPGSHYHNAMTDLSKDLKKPSIQKRVFSFSKSSPSELVRSRLSATEISHRALTYLPDDLLNDIPENDASYSLFQGFKASVDIPSPAKKTKGLLEDTTGANNVTRLTRERDRTNEDLDLIGVRKSIASGEIREIDRKIAQLSAIRGLVLERLAKLEQEETQLEHDLLELDNKIEDIQYDMVEDGQSPIENDDPDQGFMSESIYSKLPSPKGRKRQKRKAMPILHEHMAPGSEIKEMQCHADNITALDFDFPFGKLVTAALDDTVRVWDLNSGRSLGQLEGHHASVKCLQVEDNYVATGSTDATIRFWDLSRTDGPSSSSSLPGSNNVTHKRGPKSNQEDDFEDDMSAISSPTGPRSSAGTQDCHLLTLDSHIGEVTALYFQNGTLVSGSADKTLRQWDLSTGRCVQTLDILWTASSNAGPEDSGWSFASLGRSSGRANLSEMQADFVGALQCFDAALACGTSDGLVRLWDLRSGQVHRSLVGHTGPVTALQFDDTYLVTGSMDRSIRIWDLRTGSISDAFAYENPITSMQFDAARIVSAAGENYAKIYDRVDGRHWNCGAGAEGGKEDRLSTPAIVDRVRAKEGYLVEGRRDGVVGVWTC
ncbi:Mitochondrial fission protein, variant 2 [Orbilia blumenaviensis]|uniref:Mitochondrial division protein 1 n=1 Tax=Orbilia blumenaviensis TaxID=1796055 RepID=A0AAV9UN03_9PEZI